MNDVEDAQPRPPGEFQWQATNAPAASSRTDDIWFADADRGWAVNSNGHILFTADGGATWTRQHSDAGIYLRCIGFANDQLGWVGTLAENRRLLRTTDGGATWVAVEGLPAAPPPAICGLSVVNENVVYASGSNFVEKPTGVLKTVDGGATWTAQDLSEHATMLVDIFFHDEQRGFVVGGKASVENPDREDCVPIVLATDDGGQTWEDRLAGLDLASGEWGWKIHFVNDRIGFVSMENFADAAILKTVDGGTTWERKPVNDPQDNANLEGIGFVDERLGWAGGWGDANFESGFTSETRDGGETWIDANHVGKFLNRFRFVHGPELVGYACGDTVYKYSAVAAGAAPEAVRGPAGAEIARTSFPVRLPLEATRGARAVRVDVWDRFGAHVATPFDESTPATETAELAWSGETDSGGTAGPGLYIVRVTADDWSTSRTVVVEA